MNPEEKIKKFEIELSFIKNDKIREFTEKAIGLLPDYFFVIPASTSRKYHPQFAAGEGGLVRHTQAAVRLAKELFRLDMLQYLSDDDKDLVLASLILHDGNKAGKMGLHTVAEHPLLMSDFLKNNSELKGIISDQWLDTICGNIEHHMGQWTQDYKTGKQVLNPPKGRMQNFVHLIDYIVSRRMVEINLEAKMSD